MYNIRITSYNVCYTKLLRFPSDADLSEQHSWQIRSKRDLPKICHTTGKTRQESTTLTRQENCHQKATVLHHNDADGFGAAFAIWSAGYQDATYLPVQYDQP